MLMDLFFGLFVVDLTHCVVVVIQSDDDVFDVKLIILLPRHVEVLA
jgi:hypothetical protein